MLKMWRSLFLLHLIILPLCYAAISWDLAIAVNNVIEFLNVTENGDERRAMSATLQQEIDARVLAFDPVQNRMFVSSKLNDKRSGIFQVDLDNINNMTLIHTEENVRHEILGIAYYHVTDTLFWTNGYGNTISRLSLKDGKKQVLHQLRRAATGIALDVCSGTLFWSTRNGTIERSSVEGEDPVVIVREQNNPSDLTVDQRLRRLFWCDYGPGIHFHIESSDFNGSSRNTSVTDINHQPVSIATTRTHIYWTNRRDQYLYRVPIGTSNGPIKKAFPFERGTTMGLISRDNTLMLQDCGKMQRIETTTEIVMEGDKGGFEAITDSPYGSGRTVEFENFCLNGGILRQAEESSHLFLFCECRPGYSGQKCQYECAQPRCNGSSPSEKLRPQLCNCSDVCEEMCQRRIEENIPPVLCPPTAEVKNDQDDAYNISMSSHTTQDSDMCYNDVKCLQTVVISLISICFLLLLILVYLTKRNITLRKRPRIKKRIIINKNVTPLTSRPPPADDQCEITIENCCNMNICETPCYEPHLRSDGKNSSKTEEKKNLLGSMEEETSCPPCQDNLY